MVVKPQPPEGSPALLVYEDNSTSSANLAANSPA
jgi:hypothetical protein